MAATIPLLDDDVRELSDQFKISARSIGEVAEAVNAMVSRFKTTGAVRFRDKPLTREALVNALVLYVDALPAAEKARVVGAGVARLEAIMSGDDAPAAPADEGKAPVFYDAPPDAPAPDAPRKRKRG